jgi:hypothetical protein
LPNRNFHSISALEISLSTTNVRRSPPSTNHDGAFSTLIIVNDDGQLLRRHPIWQTLPSTRSPPFPKSPPLYPVSQYPHLPTLPLPLSNLPPSPSSSAGSPVLASRAEDTATPRQRLSPTPLFPEPRTSQIHTIYLNKLDHDGFFLLPPPMILMYPVRYRLSIEPGCRILNPYSASGTTALSAGMGFAPTHSRSRSSASVNDEILASSLPPSTVIGHLKEPPPSIHTLKKKGQVFKCESCAKVYRHPSWYAASLPASIPEERDRYLTP